MDHENNGEGSDIAMTAIITNEDSKDIYFNKSIGSEIKIDNPVKLVRTVAKVLLTCVTKEDDPNYVKVIDSNDYETKSEENTGWIKLANVNYMLNVLNRKTYMDYREEKAEDGTYYLEEVSAPDGYILPESDVEFRIINGKITYTSVNNKDSFNDTSMKIPNTAGEMLPETGGSGTTLLTIGGLLLMAGAVGGGYGLRRRRGKEGR